MLDVTVTVALAVPNLEEDLLKMPNISQGILDDLLPNQEASKGLNLEESLLKSKKFTARFSLNRQVLTKTETLQEPHLSR